MRITARTVLLAAVALLIVVPVGVAETHYLISSAGQIKPSVRKALSHPTGPAGGALAGKYPDPTLAPSPKPITPQCNLVVPHGGWCNDGSYPYASYYRDAMGVVHLGGVVQSMVANVGVGLPEQNLCGEGGDGDVIFTLPAGYRPARHLIFAVESGDADGRVDVMPDGEVQCVVGRGDLYVSLDGITFEAG